MDRETHDRMVGLYWDILKLAEADPEYVRLRQVMEELEARYTALAGQMPGPSREAIELYIASREALNRRLLEVACGELAASQ